MSFKLLIHSATAGKDHGPEPTAAHWRQAFFGTTHTASEQNIKYPRKTKYKRISPQCTCNLIVS
jgi:hypothetical protein